MRFEDAILWVRSGGRARRKIWASVTEYTRTTPPINYQREWHIWMADNMNIVNGWGGKAGATLDANDPVRDGQLYLPSDDDRVATDWEQ